MTPTSDDLRPNYDVPARHEANRAGWNEGARQYTAQIADTVAFISQGRSSLHPIERRNLGELRPWCHTAIHLQCASGSDTLSLFNEGVARVVGVDISDVHIENARQTCAALAALGRPPQAEWFRCDVLETPAALDGLADLVYTGRGALSWLHDIGAYARVVARLLKPGGVYHVFDTHPLTNLLDYEADTYVFRGVPYFGHTEASVGFSSANSAHVPGVPLAQQAIKYERGWTLMEITNALIAAGLTLEYLGEHAENFWEPMPRLKPELRGLFPMTFSIRARNIR